MLERKYTFVNYTTYIFTFLVLIIYSFDTRTVNYATLQVTTSI
jgi:hypothetical protein